MVDSAPLTTSLSAFAFVNDSIDITSARIKVNLFIKFYFCVLYTKFTEWVE